MVYSGQGHHHDISGHKMQGRHVPKKKAIFDQPVGVHQGVSSMSCDIFSVQSTHGPSQFCWGPLDEFSGKYGLVHW